MCVVIVGCLAFFLTMVYRASLQPGTRRPRRERMVTGVRGGTHIAVGGRSVAPDRNAPVTVLPEADVAAETVSMAEPESTAEPVSTAERVSAAAVPRVPASRLPHHDAVDAPETAAAAEAAAPVPGAPVPSPRSGHADRPARSTTEPGV